VFGCFSWTPPLPRNFSSNDVTLTAATDAVLVASGSVFAEELSCGSARSLPPFELFRVYSDSAWLLSRLAAILLVTLECRHSITPDRCAAADSLLH
jgi:hypothetical protein